MDFFFFFLFFLDPSTKLQEVAMLFEISASSPFTRAGGLIKCPLSSLKSRNDTPTGPTLEDVRDLSEGDGPDNMKMGKLKGHFMCFVFFFCLTPVMMSPLHPCNSITALLGAHC